MTERQYIRRMRKGVSLLAFLSCLVASAQNGFPFPHQNAVWTQAVDLWSTDGWPQYLGRQYRSFVMLEADTLIDGSLYTQVFDEALNYVAAVRDTAGKVMAVPGGLAEEFLLYDFTLPVGVDTTMDVWLLDHQSVLSVTMRSEGPIGEGGRIVVQSSESFYQWIEGIGCTAGLFMEPWINVSGYALSLECMSANDTIHYPSTQPGNCVITNALPVTSEEEPVVFPVPAGDLLHVSSTIPFRRFSVFSLDGRLISSGTFFGADRTLDTAHLPPGAYVVELVHEKQVSRIPFIKD